MKNRKFLYGYLRQNGRLAVHPREVMTVRNITSMYLEGLSYQKIAETLNHSRIPYSEEVPLWNKHKVKRLLENPRYAGADGYPAEIEKEVFEAVQEQIRSKTACCTQKAVRPALWLKPYLRCGSCGGALSRISEKTASTETMRFKCGKCGVRMVVRDEDLIAKVTEQLGTHDAPMEKRYVPSEEVIRLTNAVNRRLEHPDSPEELIRLILRGVSARYDCCPSADDHTPPRRLSEDALKRFGETASHITISEGNVITVHFPKNQV